MKSLFVKGLSDSDIIQCLDELLIRRNTDGNLKPHWKVKSKFQESDYDNFMYFEQDLIWEAHFRFSAVVKMLMLDNSSFYISR